MYDDTSAPEGLGLAELQQQQATELPARELMIAITLLGIPIIGLNGIELHIT